MDFTATVVEFKLYLNLGHKSLTEKPNENTSIDPPCSLRQSPVGQLYGRRLSRPLRLIDRQILRDDFPAHVLDLGMLNQITTPIHLEIGFGDGRHLLAQAQRYQKINYENNVYKNLGYQVNEYPDGVLFIGCEPFKTGILRVSKNIQAHAITNIRLVDRDARILLRELLVVQQSLNKPLLDRVYVLFPDPWPKARHHKRRLLQHDFFHQLASLLRIGGQLRIATDDPSYQQWLINLLAAPGIQQHWVSTSSRLERPNVIDWPMTKYEEKASTAHRNAIFWMLERR